MFLSVTILLAVEIISTEVTRGDIFAVTPANLAIVAGKQLRLECGVPINLTIHWYYHWYYHATNIKAASVLMYNSDQLSSKFADDFSVDISTTGQHDLVAKRTKLEHAGVYECAVLEGTNSNLQRHSANAQLIVLVSDPVCWSNLSSPNHTAAEFDTVLIQCDLNYNGKWSPMMEWSKQLYDHSSALEPAPNELYSNVHNLSSFVIMQVNSSDNGATVICKTHFISSGNQLATNATNIPDYVSQWNITVNVEYGPKNMSIIPILDSYKPGGRLVCQADANPSPSFRWKDIETSSTVDEYEIIIVKNAKEHDAEYMYVCVAENWVKGHKRSTSLGFTVKIKGNVWLVVRGYIFGFIGVLSGIMISAVVFKLRLSAQKQSQDGLQQPKTDSEAPVHLDILHNRDSTIQQPVEQYEVMRRSTLDAIYEGSQTQEHEATSLYEVIGTDVDMELPSDYYNLPST